MLTAPAGAAGEGGDYVIGPQDVLLVTVFDQADLGGKYARRGRRQLLVSAHRPGDGRRRTIRDVETELKTRLARGYFKNPQVTVSIEQYPQPARVRRRRGQQRRDLFLTGDMTLIEALAKAGSTTPAAGNDVVVVHGKGADAAVLPDARADSEVMRLNLKDLQSGAATVRNIQLADGDTIYVPRADSYTSSER